MILSICNIIKIKLELHNIQENSKSGTDEPFNLAVTSKLP